MALNLKFIVQNFNQIVVVSMVNLQLGLGESRRRAEGHSEGKTGVTADRDKIQFRLFNSSSIFNIILHEELFSLPKQNQRTRIKQPKFNLVTVGRDSSFP